MPGTPTSTININCRITFAVIGMVVGSSIFGSFGFYFRNWHCAVWGLASGIFAALTLGIHIEYCKYEWNRKPNFLSVIMLFGCLAQFSAISACIIYIVLGIYYGQSFNLPKRLWSALNRLLVGQGCCAYNLINGVRLLIFHVAVVQCGQRRTLSMIVCKHVSVVDRLVMTLVTGWANHIC